MNVNVSKETGEDLRFRDHVFISNKVPRMTEYLSTKFDENWRFSHLYYVTEYFSNKSREYTVFVEFNVPGGIYEKQGKIYYSPSSRSRKLKVQAPLDLGWSLDDKPIEPMANHLLAERIKPALEQIVEKINSDSDRYADSMSQYLPSDLIEIKLDPIGPF